VGQEQATSNYWSGRSGRELHRKVLSDSYYGLLGVHPSASLREIRQAYRDLSKLYHPDTTTLPAAIATAKFQQLNEAYGTLSNPERRTAYNLKIGYSSVPVVQTLPGINRFPPKTAYSSSAYLDPTDRPLSPGELFALFILGVTFVGCLFLAIAVGLTRSETLLGNAATSPYSGSPPAITLTQSAAATPPGIQTPATPSSP